MSQQERRRSLGQSVLRDLRIVRRHTHVPEVEDQAAVWGCPTRAPTMLCEQAKGRREAPNPNTQTHAQAGVPSTTHTRVRRELCY